MNIIEDIRDALLHTVEKISPPPRTPMDLLTALQDSWCEKPPGCQDPDISRDHATSSCSTSVRSWGPIRYWTGVPDFLSLQSDTLAKEATTNGIPASLPFPKSFLNKQLLQLSLSRWQAEWDNGETGRSVYSIIPKISNKQLHWSRECMQFATGHGPFPSYLKRFGLHSTDYCRCGEIGNPLHYATRWPLTLSYHHKEPSPQFIVHWWKSALSRKLLRGNIDHLMTFLATNEDLIKSQNTTPSHTPV
ncbi:hypothetical protein AVEN_129106-1 [Araneus ventricosus]|uniref:Uncharacterized protein n=1 Tax=Araneus ventricosus TaxID=182803 RepID=A0A4Y2HHC4_ARAVE|nr:hypothetical protein AVEN_129106-1 [Araneus ventricosus]